MAEVVLRDVSKEYDLHTMGLTDVSLSFSDGSITTIVGAAGSGKSTLLGLISGLIDITSGDLFIGGKRVNSVEPKYRDVCLMREGDAACGGSVYDNISYGLRLRHYPRAETDRRTSEAARLAGLADKLGVKMKKLSPLNRRRVSLARALARRPEVFLLDDPFFNISAEDRLALAADIGRAHQRSGLTFIAASSFGDDAFLLGGRVAVLKDGRVVQTGSREELLEAPANMFVASFVGDDRMSFYFEEGVTKGVRVSDAAISERGTYEGEVTGTGDGVVFVRLQEGAPPVAVRTDSFYAAGDRVKVSFDKTLRFDPENGELMSGK